MIAVITGASRGIGKSVAEVFAEQGFDLAICARNEDDLELLGNELKDKYPNQTIVHKSLDCANKDELLAFVDFIAEELGTVDVLVNNVGQYIPSTIMDEEDGSLEAMIETNVYPAYYLSKYLAGPMLEEGKGHIFNICSIASIKPVIAAGSYSVSKIALLGLTKVLREELMYRGIKVTAVLPGSTLTASWEGTTIPASRFIQPEDVASAILNAWKMSEGAVVDEIIIRPTFGEV
ncbi:SDR family oxidoreductase [Solitalea koreensis]|uniref:Short-chain dehydrogenase n=1 Tax=Solitalea koreensis TaxID=543615 RepID=A0A521ACG7_9SPHI|nr:SDR family oxidoreductase [Solitalea koreensis]SMO32380.1 Short-chain dehydrogenase [Solitalea koreensis]